MNGSIRSRRAALAALALATSAGLLLPGTSAEAGQPTAVTLTPEPPDFYSCTVNGAGTRCTAETRDAYGPEPTGIFCGSFEVLDQAVHVSVAERWYDRDGNLVKRRRVNSFEDAAFSSPEGTRVAYTQRDIDTDVFTIPGDITLGTTYSNSSLRATVPGLGAVVVDKGRVVWGDEGLEKEAGRHELLDYFLGDPSSLDSLCAALGA
jgi:hypothetical protein